MQPAYPTVGDIQARFVNANITQPPDAPRITQALASAITDWENEVCWKPFLSDGSITTRYYDPPGADRSHASWAGLRGGGVVLDLQGGLISLTSLQISGFTWTGAPAGGYGQFWLRPDNAPYKRPVAWPYDEIEFLIAPFAGDQGVAISGVWGFSTQVPDDAFDAIVSRTLWKLTPDIAARRAGGAANRKTGAIDERFAVGKDAGPFAFESSLWLQQWKDTTNNYTRQPVGV